MQVLDKGYVEAVPKGCWGSDELIIEAARMSTNKGFQGWGERCKKCGISQKVFANDFDGPLWTGCKDKTDHEWQPGDEKLLAYLWNNKHHTPFEMAGATFEIYAPIFVIREWHRHRTFSYNEMSGRYTELPNDYYIPSIERLIAAKQGLKNKQGSEAGFGELEADLFQRLIRETIQDSRNEYEYLIECGVAREVARMVLPVSQYSRFRASGNLRNWLHFLRLRLAENAQYEIREYAKAVATTIKTTFPRTYQLFSESL